MGEIVSCISRRSKLDSLLTDEERTQLIGIYEALSYDKEQVVLATVFRALLQKEVTRLRTNKELKDSLWSDWQDVSLYLRRVVLVQTSKAVRIDRLSFLHMWKTHGTSKRIGGGMCCHVKRQEMSASDYDEQSWRISHFKKLMLAKQKTEVPQPGPV
jgi:hypothetical protein